MSLWWDGGGSRVSQQGVIPTGADPMDEIWLLGSACLACPLAARRVRRIRCCTCPSSPFSQSYELLVGLAQLGEFTDTCCTRGPALVSAGCEGGANPLLRSSACVSCLASYLRVIFRASANGNATPPPCFAHGKNCLVILGVFGSTERSAMDS